MASWAALLNLQISHLADICIVNGCLQLQWYEKHQASSPTVFLDALFLSLIIDAYEERDIAIVDIAGAYFNAVIDEFIIVKLTGDYVSLMCDVCSELQEFVVTEHSEQVLYSYL